MNTTIEIQDPKSKTVDLKNQKLAASFKNISIHESTAVVLEKLSKQANGTGPKRVQWKDIVEVGVSKVTSEDLKKLRQQKLTGSDRLEEMFTQFKVGHPDSDRDQFLDYLLKNLDSKNTISSSQTLNK